MIVRNKLLSLKVNMRRFSSCAITYEKHSCKLLVLGGGTGGCSMAAKFTSKLGKNQVIIVEPSDVHYYQPMLTLVGGGVKTLQDISRPMHSVLPRDALWVRDLVVSINPERSTVTTEQGHEIAYEYLIVALGLEMHFDQIEGLLEALSIPDSGVCSNYSPLYVGRTVDALNRFKSGDCIFTFPNTPVKCAGAPQKACYLSEHYLRNAGIRDKANFMYKTSLPVLFAVKRYADQLAKVCADRKIEFTTRQNLVKIKPETREAVFENLDQPDKLSTFEFSMLHVTPPMGPPLVLRLNPLLSDQTGFLRVDKATLQHETFSNVFGIGDCTNLPTSKTAAAVAAQCGVLATNLWALMNNKSVSDTYDGYTSCPLVTGFGTCIMAEFDYNLQPLETFPINQSKEHHTMYFMKKNIMPIIYWQVMLKGYWNGPKIVRKILHLGLSK